MLWNRSKFNHTIVNKKINDNSFEDNTYYSVKFAAIKRWLKILMQVEVLHTQNVPEIRWSARRKHTARDLVIYKTELFWLPTGTSLYYLVQSCTLANATL